MKSENDSRSLLNSLRPRYKYFFPFLSQYLFMTTCSYAHVASLLNRRR